MLDQYRFLLVHSDDGLISSLWDAQMDRPDEIVTPMVHLYSARPNTAMSIYKLYDSIKPVEIFTHLHNCFRTSDHINSLGIILDFCRKLHSYCMRNIQRMDLCKLRHVYMCVYQKTAQRVRDVKKRESLV